MGVTVQGEHDGPEEDRSDPEGRGAHGPARPDVRSSGEEEHERTRPGRSRIDGRDAVANVASDARASEFDVRVFRALRRTEEPQTNIARLNTSWEGS